MTLAGMVYIGLMLTHLNIGEMTMRLLEQSGRAQQMTDAQKTQLLSIYNGPFAKVGSGVVALIGPTLTVLVVTVIYFGLFTLIGREGGFRSFFAVTAFAFIPNILRTIAGILTILIVPQSQLSLDEIGNIGPSVFLDRTAVSKHLFAAASQLDLVVYVACRIAFA